MLMYLNTGDIKSVISIWKYLTSSKTDDYRKFVILTNAFIILTNLD
jgi:hypothetical protein